MLSSFYFSDKPEKTGRKRKSSMPSSLPKSPSTAAPTSLATPIPERPSSLPRHTPTASWHPQQLHLQPPPQQQQHHQQQQQQQPPQHPHQQPQQQPSQFPRKMEPEEQTMLSATTAAEDSEKTSTKRAKLEAAENERLLNFATAADEYEVSLKRQKMARDPLSHRIIEKRRRDRMNNCLADLSRLIPSSYHKQGQGRIEKTEIIEMATRHIMMLQQKLDEAEKKIAKEEKPTLPPPPPEELHCCATKFYMGFKEAQDEVMRFLVEVESINAMDPFCKKIMNHLENANKKFRTKCIQPPMYPQQSAHIDLLPGGSPGDSTNSNASNISSSGNGTNGMHPYNHHHNHRFHHHLNHHQSDTSGIDTDPSSSCSTSGVPIGSGYPPHHHHHHPHLPLQPQQRPLQHPGHHPMAFYPGNPADAPPGLAGPSPESAAVMGMMGSQDESSMEAQQRDQRLRTLLADQQHQQQQQHMMASSSLSSSSSFCNSSIVYSESGSINGHNGCNNGSMSEAMCGSNNSLVPLFSYSSHLSGMTPMTPDSNGVGSSGYVSDLSTLEKTSPNGSTSSRENVYKFKHNITKRFCQEGHVHHHHRHHHHHHQGQNQPSDTSSNDSGRDPETDKAQIKWKSSKHHKNRGGGGGGGSAIYQDDDSSEGNNSGSNSGSNNSRSNSGSSGADNSSNTNSDNFNSVSSDCKPSLRRRGNSSSGKISGQVHKTENGNCSSSSSSSSSSSLSGSSIALPGFILHPQGTHYMPISVHNTNLTDLFDSGSDRESGAPVFHPISIPVHFRRPVISMPNVSICTHMSTHRRDRNNKE
ncbi:hairy/enhancer-of-split related with yrpw motif protein 1 [Plakobranchus ocellatus]|uniref:Hairy/enhancer-of-split related with yrpw motif protein 1 n=1 Tax=Plakobranchus ocellatus TaxID=259542 RepID=A0AAV4DEW0_9GAST|nr:hairy/enhancer-of-split related with yrpw motif protein 1 [Plakobranchus ocellatus]